MFFTAINALHSLTPDSDPFSPEALDVVYDEGRILELAKVAGLRHAHYGSLATAIGALGLLKLAPLLGEQDRALIAVGCNAHLTLARDFGERLDRSGARLVNPVAFPNILPSATAVTLGRLAGAHVCSIAVDGTGAFGRALRCARSLLQEGDAAQVIIVITELRPNNRATSILVLASWEPLGDHYCKLDSLIEISDGPEVNYCMIRSLIAR